MKLIVGLGNPGKEYEKTRHNVGFRLVQAFAIQKEFSEWKSSEKFQALITETEFGDEKVLLALPQTFMNLSGASVASLLKFYKLDGTKDLLVISDDKDMVFGKLRERNEGSSGGHKGLQSIIEHLGTEHFHRLKMGVGRVARPAVRSEGLSPKAEAVTKDSEPVKSSILSGEESAVPIEHERISTSAFVLQKFSTEEEERLPQIISAAIQKIEGWLRLSAGQ